MNKLRIKITLVDKIGKHRCHSGLKILCNGLGISLGEV